MNLTPFSRVPFFQVDILGAMDSETHLGKALVSLYQHSPAWVQSLVQLIPAGSAADSFLSTKYREYERERMRAFFDELAVGSISLNQSVLESEDFLHCYFKTVRAVLRSRRRQKAVYMARLLKASFEHDTIESVDEYEELCAILDELTHRELTVLALLAKHEQSIPAAPNESPLLKANGIWPAFVTDVEKHTRIKCDMIQPVLVRLERSGCYEEIKGTYFDYVGGRGTLTPLYFRLVELVGNMTPLAVAQ